MKPSSRPAPLSDHRVEIALGIGLFIGASWLFFDAYEGRGRKRPFIARLLPG